MAYQRYPSKADTPAPSPPLNLSHHYSRVTARRTGSQIKELYKYFEIPGIGNLAGGMPNASFFPYVTLEAQTARADRFQTTPNEPSSTSGISGKLASTKLETPDASADHIVVPYVSTATNPLHHIDVTTALQYGQATGYPPLFSFIRQFTRENLHPNIPYLDGPDVVLTCGNTDGFSKALQAFCNEWSPEHDWIGDRQSILCEEFAYLTGIAGAQTLGVRTVPVKIDKEGMLPFGPGGVEDILENWDIRQGKRPHMMYTITVGQNPTGGTLSAQRRKDIYAICSKYDVLIVEDDPYWCMQFPSVPELEASSRGLPPPEKSQPHQFAKSSGSAFLDSLVPSYMQFDTDGRVIRLDTFSKTIAPGCRLGWITAQPAIIERITRIAEATTAVPSGFVQAMLAETLIGPQMAAKADFLRRSRADQKTYAGWKVDGFVRWLEGLRGAYERRMTRMSTILDAGRFHLEQGTSTKSADSDWAVISKTRMYSFNWPRGGMFVWVRMHFETHPLATEVSLQELARLHWLFMTQKPFLVLVAPGVTFCPSNEIRDDRGWQYYRLCFAAVTEEDVDRCSESFARASNAFWSIQTKKELEDIDNADALELAEGVRLFNLGGDMGC